MSSGGVSLAGFVKENVDRMIVNKFLKNWKNLEFQNYKVRRANDILEHLSKILSASNG